MSADYDAGSDPTNPIPDDDASVAERVRARLAANERLDRIVRDWQEEQMVRTRENGARATPEVTLFPRPVGSGGKPASPVQRLPWAFWQGVLGLCFACLAAVGAVLCWPWDPEIVFTAIFGIAAGLTFLAFFLPAFLELSPTTQALTEIARSSTDPVAEHQAWMALVEMFGQHRAGELLNAGTGHDAGRWRTREEDRS